MIYFVAIATLINSAILAYLVYQNYTPEGKAKKSVRGLLTANYVALRRLENAADRIDDAVGVYKATWGQFDGPKDNE